MISNSKASILNKRYDELSSQSFIRKNNQPSFDDTGAQDLTADATRNLLYDKLNESSTASFNQTNEKKS